MLSFVLNQKVVQTDENPGMVVLDFVRGVSCLSGTKEACREGECGACTVLVGTPGPQGLTYKACASCLLPLGDVQGCHVVTIEGLSSGPLTLVQQLIVEHSASQCGFCTPGVVLSLTAFSLTSPAFAAQEALDALDGNLCRCTGYVAIRKAAQALSERLAGANPDPTERVATLVSQGVIPEYFLQTQQRLAELAAPATSPEPDSPQAVLVAGGTDLFVQRPEQLLEAPLTFLSQRRDLDYIRRDDGCLRVGGAVTLEDFRLSPQVHALFPSLRQDLLLHSSTILRNRATLTGNIVNASPIGDMTVILLALQARLVIQAPPGERREVPLDAFYQGYKTYDLRPGELITELVVPGLPPGGRFNFEKVSNRVILDIAAVNSALRLVTAPDGTIADLRLAAGGVAPTPLLVPGLERFHGLPPDQDTVVAIAQHAMQVVTPISDIRGEADYKKLLLGQLVRAHFSAEVKS